MFKVLILVIITSPQCPIEIMFVEANNEEEMCASALCTVFTVMSRI